MRSSGRLSRVQVLVAITLMIFPATVFPCTPCTEGCESEDELLNLFWSHLGSEVNCAPVTRALREAKLTIVPVPQTPEQNPAGRARIQRLRESLERTISRDIRQNGSMDEHQITAALVPLLRAHAAKSLSLRAQ